MPEYLNVISTKRSGHHAFIAWYRHHAPDQWMHLNNRSLDRLIRRDLVKVDAPRILINFEGVTPEGIERVRAREDGTAKSRTDVIFLRHPLNMLASFVHRVEKKFAKGLTGLAVHTILRQVHAQNYWSSLRTDLPRYSYDPWVSDESYRAKMADALGLTGNSPLKDISEYGGGSSFTGVDDTVDPLDRLNRWSIKSDSAIFKSIATHPAIMSGLLDALEGRHPADSLGYRFDDLRAAEWLKNAAKERVADPAVDDIISNTPPGGRAMSVMERRSGWPRKLGQMHAILEDRLRASR
ncbi:hypothetical protein [Roseobacter sp. HKCCA0434]|uniref:hypothetical protein n=1 Tax=Roseobacter sp. HKCCA0434 TaxID=3079297 RepID=UPI002905A43E|nr:hypothetical protein [Roseobacter sp. HKCCA0434]